MTRNVVTREVMPDKANGGQHVECRIKSDFHDDGDEVAFVVEPGRDGQVGYVALYRQWRPQTFAAVVGQKHITVTLRHSLQEGRLAHAYLFSGPRGTGKTSTAKIFAKALNCLAPAGGEPCNRCANCLSINAGSFLDILEIDAASHRRIDDIRELQERLPFGPVHGRYKVYIIDEVHMLTPEAFNALLKTLEEPPAHVVFVLATTEAQKIPPTILSRCLRFDFRPLSLREIAGYLQQVAGAAGMELEERVAWALARMARGALRDALSLLEECTAYAGPHLRLEDVQLVLGLPGEEEVLALGENLWRGDPGRLLEWLANAWEQGRQPPEILRELLGYLRDLLTLKLCPGRPELVRLSPASLEDLKRQAAMVTPGRVQRAVAALSDLEGQLRLAGQPEVLVELALLEIAAAVPAGREQDRVAALEARLQKLEKMLLRYPAVAKQETVEAGAKAAVEEQPAARAAETPAQPHPPLPETDAEPQVVELGPGLRPVEDVAWWSRVMELARRTHKVRTLLGGVRAVGMEGGHLVLGFSKRFHKEQTEEQGARATVEGIVGKILKRPIKVECILLSEKPPAAAPGDPREAENNVLEEALRLFGGSVVSQGEED